MYGETERTGATLGRRPGVGPGTGNPLSRPTALSEADFSFLARLVHERAGIVVRKEKRHMLAGRLTKRVRALGLGDFRAYCALLASPEGAGEILEMVNAVTTNLTQFFRERHHFNHLASTAMPAILGGRGAGDPSRLRIWSAGCSTGQEPYSIAMTLLGRCRIPADWDVRILATDVDSRVIETAAAGRYAKEQETGLSDTERKRFTRRLRDGGITIGDDARALISFAQLNLIEPWPMSGPFDIVFCRNVIIYFDKPTQMRLFERIADLMAPGGWLYIGHSESLFKITDRFERAGGTIYRKVA